MYVKRLTRDAADPHRSTVGLLALRHPSMRRPSKTHTSAHTTSSCHTDAKVAAKTPLDTSAAGGVDAFDTTADVSLLMAVAQLMKKKKKRRRRTRVPFVPIKKPPTTHFVEAVLAKRSTENGTEYFVKWLHYDSSDCSWIQELPSAFEAAWGDTSDKPYTTDNMWQALLGVACERVAPGSE